MSDSKKDKPETDAALKARLAQLELENRMRLQKHQPTQGMNPIKDTPRRGFGSAQGIAHLRHTEYQRRGPAPPAAPAPIPEPGKARFGGTYLQTPLPGIISAADATPGQELIAPVPAVPTAPQTPPPAAGKDPRARPPQVAGAHPPAPPAAKGQPPSAAMPGGRPLPGAQPPLPAKEVAQAKPGAPVPPEAAFDAGKRRVVGGSPLAKAPLPALYHAGMKAAEAVEKSQAGAKPPTAAEAVAMGKPAAEIVIPDGSEVTKDGPKTPRVKRFKNPTLAPKTKDPG